MTTPCDYPDNDGIHRCPYSEDPTSETCRYWCGEGVSEDPYPWEEDGFDDYD